jgi:hypothetical protein
MRAVVAERVVEIAAPHKCDWHENERWYVGGGDECCIIYAMLSRTALASRQLRP